MTRETGVANLNLRATYNQDAGLTRVQHLKRHEIAVQLRANDLRVKLGQLREEQAPEYRTRVGILRRARVKVFANYLCAAQVSNDGFLQFVHKIKSSVF